MNFRSILNDLSEYKEEGNLSENNVNIESNFFNPELNLDEEEEEDLETLNKKRYYCEPKTKVTKDSTSNSVNQETKIKKIIFNTNKVTERERERERLRERERERERESSQQLLQNKRRRGRRPNAEIQIESQVESQENPKRKKLSRKFGKDNIITKSQNHYINYIIIVFNMILIFFGFKEKVKNIDYEIKKKPNYDNFTELMKKTLGEIISKPITTKFQNIESNYNAELVKEIREKNIEVINNFLNYNYLSFFRNYYYRNSKKIYLKDFGSKDESYILLSDEKITFQEKINTFGDENYANVYKKVVEELYFPKMFSTNN
jgi:hypothetical protein